MKNTTIFLAALALVFACSCQRIEESFVQEETVSGEEMTFTATLAEASPFEVLETKTALQSNEKDIYWTPGDAVNIFYGNSSAGKFTTQISQPSQTASFTGNIGVATGSAGDGFVAPTFWAVYPYDIENTCDGNSVTLKIQGTQKASAGSFGIGMNPSIANSPGLGLSFYNVGSWFRFSVSQEGITSAVFSGNADEVLAGKVTLTMDSDKKPLITNVEDGLTSITVTPEDGGAFVPGKLYYITLIPQTIASTGYTLTLYKGRQTAKCVVSAPATDPTKTYEFARSMYRGKKNADEGLTWEGVSDGYLGFTAVEDGTISLSNTGDNAPNIEYSTDCISWTSWDYSAITVPAGAKIYLKGNNSNGFSYSSIKYSTFVMTGKFVASGSIQSLLYGDEFEDNRTIPTGSYCFYKLFSGCTALTSDIVSPAASAVTNGRDKKILLWTSQTAALELPATTLADNCYDSMFSDCTNLATAPDLPASRLEAGCYSNMFNGCSNLSYIKMMATDISAADCLSDWVAGVNATGTFVKNQNATWDIEGADGIPASWTVQAVKSNNVIYYTSQDGNVITPYASDVFGANIISHEYVDGRGVITFDGEVTSIGAQAFFLCMGLTSIIVPDSVTSIGTAAFYGCNNLTSINVPEGVTKIGSEAFSGCLLTSIVIPENVTSIEQYTFEGCSSLTSITIPENVTWIGYNSFIGCTGLTSITIPKNVTDIGSGAFNDCSGLVEIYCYPVMPPSGAYQFENTNQCPIYVPAESVENYKASWPAYADRIQAIPSVKLNNVIYYTSQDGNMITPYASDVFGANIISHEYVDGRGVISFDGEVTSIGEQAFFMCSGLTSIIVPDSVTSIGTAAFYECNNLTSINVPEGVTRIGSDAFSVCYSLTSIVIPENVTSIEQNTFEGCSSLTSITIPENVTWIGNDSFIGCTGLTSITIPKNVTDIGLQAFNDCSGLVGIYCYPVMPPGGGGGRFENTNQCPIYVPAESVENYKASWPAYADRIQAIQ